MSRGIGAVSKPSASPWVRRPFTLFVDMHHTASRDAIVGLRRNKHLDALTAVVHVDRAPVLPPTDVAQVTPTLFCRDEGRAMVVGHDAVAVVAQWHPCPKKYRRGTQFGRGRRLVRRKNEWSPGRSANRSDRDILLEEAVVRKLSPTDMGQVSSGKVTPQTLREAKMHQEESMRHLQQLQSKLAREPQSSSGALVALPAAVEDSSDEEL